MRVLIKGGEFKSRRETAMEAAELLPHGALYLVDYNEDNARKVFSFAYKMSVNRTVIVADKGVYCEGAWSDDCYDAIIDLDAGFNGEMVAEVIERWGA